MTIDGNPAHEEASNDVTAEVTMEALMESAPNLEKTWAELQSHGLEPDVDLVCEGGFTFRVHQRYLRLASTHFESELSSEKRHRSKVVIDASPEVTIKMLEFIYTGAVEERQGFRVSRDLLKVGFDYGIPDLKTRMSAVLSKYINLRNVVSLTSLGYRYQAATLRHQGVRYMANHFDALEAHDPEWHTKLEPNLAALVRRRAHFHRDISARASPTRRFL
uniref:BTB domain-containing protein n=1 Tax=Panagrellus redivivus TaxID=6233 RepID=A0A7E4VGB7_PANRE